MPLLGLYLHVPFCRSKCLYCDFCSFPNRGEEQYRAYTDALCRDLTARAGECRRYEVDTVYLGGGTPTVLPSECLSKILDTVSANYALTSDAEITVECNPVTGDPALFEALRRAGVNRLSLGVQSVHADELRALGRLHRLSDVESTLRDARAAGFENISVDVMFGIPHQSVARYLETLERLVALEPTHLSAYGLTVEEETPFGRMGERLVLPDEEDVRRMYFLGAEFLERAGYRQYEISNFAKEGYASRHNLKYWSCEEYLGFGPAAYSDFGGKRFGNSRDLDAYLAGRPILSECETPSGEERKNEYVMLRMRTAQGVRTDDYARRFGTFFEADFGQRLERYIDGGFVRRGQERWAFTREGMYVSNAILSEILEFGN